MKDGDIFSWEWKPELGRNNRASFANYHCKSQIAVCRDGVLSDTFWGYASEALDESKIDLTFLGNIHEMTQIPENQEPLYRPEDLIIMRHRNNSGAPTYLKAGSVKSADRMREQAQYRLNVAECDKRHAEWSVQRWQEALSAIERGDLDSVHF